MYGLTSSQPLRAATLPRSAGMVRQRWALRSAARLPGMLEGVLTGGLVVVSLLIACTAGYTVYRLFKGQP